MFNFGQPVLIAVFLLGLASSLHCLSMCSGIATSLCLAAQSAPGIKSHKLYITNLVINAGRITGYMFAGAFGGSLGARAFGALDRSVVYFVLRWAAAVSFGWIGLSTVGFAPVPGMIYQLASVASNGIAAGGANRWVAVAGGVLCRGPPPSNSLLIIGGRSARPKAHMGEDAAELPVRRSFVCFSKSDLTNARARA